MKLFINLGFSENSTNMEDIWEKKNYLIEDLSKFTSNNFFVTIFTR